MSTCSAFIPQSYALSKWNAAWLPIRYQVGNTKWPVNTTDTVDAFGSVIDTFGYAQIELTGTYETYVNGEFIIITGSSVEAYNGVWRIREMVDANSIVISAPYAGDATGDVQRYYFNFRIEARVYVGIPSGHYYEAERPMRLYGTTEGEPNNDNTATIDISDFVRADLGIIENRLCEILESGEWIGNDWNMWTAYRAEFREVYDVPDADGFLTEFATEWETLGTETYYAINGAKQHLDIQGTNYGDYSMEPNVFEVPAKWISTFDQPSYFRGEEWDISIISPETEAERYGITHFVNLIEYDANGTEIDTTTSVLPNFGEGVYRFALSELDLDPATRKIELFVQRVESPSTVRVTETKTILVKEARCGNPMYLRWITALGSWEGWRFDGFVVRGVNPTEPVEIRRDIWRNFDDDFATNPTIDDRIQRSGKETRVVHTAFLNDDESNAFKWLRMSIKVQEIFFTDAGGCDGYKRKTWLPESAAFVYLDPADRTRIFRLQLTDTAPLFIQGQ